MIYRTQQIKRLKLGFMLVALCICFETAAAKRPPGVPKKKDCKNSLVATKVTNLEFGNFDGTTGGAITVSTSGSRTSTGPILVGGTVNAAAFDVSNSLSGCDYWPVSIQIRRVPADLTGPGTAMPSDIYISAPSGQFTLSATPGAATRVNVGATLTSGSLQTSGAYSTARPFRVRFKHQKP